MNSTGRFMVVLLGCSAMAAAQGTSSNGVAVRMIVTLGHSYGQPARTLHPSDLTVTQHFGDPLPITALTPLSGDRARMEMFLLVDNCSTCEPGSKFEELRKFIESQPPTTAIGIAYIQDGRLKIAENPGPDRQRAVRALSAPAGGQPANPFRALSDLIRQWPQNSSRRVVLMISNGVDPAGSDRPQDPASEAAIETAQRAGVVVYAIYHPSADYVNADFAKLDWGQVQLAHIANETGGEAYFLSFGPLPSLAPFLDDMAEHLANQYVVEFVTRPAEGAGELQEVEVNSKTPDVELMAPAKAWVPGRSPSTGPEEFSSKPR